MCLDLAADSHTSVWISAVLEIILCSGFPREDSSDHVSHKVQSLGGTSCKEGVFPSLQG